MQLARIGAHFRTDLRQEQAKLLAQDFIEDLGKYRVAEIENGFAAYRRDPNSKFFPKPAQIIEKIETDRRHRSIDDRMARKGDVVAANPDGRALPDGRQRPSYWWMQPRKCWKPDWRESEAPDDAWVYDLETNKRRPARRFA